VPANDATLPCWHDGSWETDSVFLFLSLLLHILPSLLPASCIVPTIFLAISCIVPAACEASAHVPIALAPFDAASHAATPADAASLADAHAPQRRGD
jgi:hypothetical protein